MGMVKDDPEKGNYITGLMRTMGREESKVMTCP
jgi:hypothetical protein